MAGKMTPGPWVLQVSASWPYDLCVYGGDGKLVISADRIAFASEQNSLDDCRKAVGFKPSERVDVIALIERQEADLFAISLLPELVEALRKALVAIDLLGPPQEPYGEVFMAEECALLSRIDGEAGEVG